MLHLTVSVCYRDEWSGYVPPYTPRFYNGWQPSPQAVDEVNNGNRFGQSERFTQADRYGQSERFRETSGGVRADAI